jgi:hypothetical protein
VTADRDIAIRLLVAWGLREGDPMANAAIRSIAVQAGLDNELDAASAYALGQGWLTNASPGWSTLTPAGYGVATAK